MKIGFIDVDGHNYPNIPLMKLSAYHKNKGDSVEWYEPLISGEMDIIYMSKVFTFTSDYPYFVNAKKVIQGGTGYGIKKEDMLPMEIESIFPDYSIYFEKIPEVKNTAYGFLTRGCPRNCEFCIVGKKEGLVSKKVSDLNNFWNGQKNIELLDPNTFACKDWKEISNQLIQSGSWINFNQGIDARIMTKEKLEYIKKMKIKSLHFAWDNFNDREMIIEKFRLIKEVLQYDRRKLVVYVLTNFNTTHEQDLQRIYELRELGFWPYVMIFEKEKLPRGHITKKLQRWVNARPLFESVKWFEDYLNKKGA